MNAADPTIWIAFAAGFLSFISPCMLPLYPSYLSYITGISVKDLRDDRGMMQRKAIMHTLFFMIGFSIIFISLGSLFSYVGSIFEQYQDLIRMLGGVLIFAMGLFIAGIFQPKWLMQEKKFEFASKPAGYIGSMLVGVTFAAGWTPCIGPILASVLTLSASNPGQGLPLIIAYTLGFAIPFFALSFFVGRMKWLVKHSGRIMKVGGVFMMIVGILLYTDQMTKITIWLIKLYGGFTGF
ncbi:MAG: cytochrome c biogenesis protein CcdA [Bacillaceae bacterium]|nr:cytochrome c biogenesis protein CcdA [Bacillaceae bacterium]